MKDERIEQATNKIRSELASLIYGIVAISFLTKLWIYNMDLSRCWTEYIILIFTPLYQFVRAHSMKISNSSKRSFKVFVIEFAILIAIIGIFVYKAIANNSNYDLKRAVCNVSVFIVLFIFIYFWINKSEQKQVKKYEDKFDD